MKLKLVVVNGAKVGASDVEVGDDTPIGRLMSLDGAKAVAVELETGTLTYVKPSETGEWEIA